jgi:hypothetical protein
MDAFGMKFLLDTMPQRCLPSDLIAGQLMTPEGNHRLCDHAFAVDNGAFSKFNPTAYRKLLAKCEPAASRCLFVALPDVVGSARRTLEMFDQWDWQLNEKWPRALVAQDGQEDLPIPWNRIACIFVGGTTEWKESHAARDIVKAALIAEKHVHVGRVNHLKRYWMFEKLAHTCDGTGVLLRGQKRFDAMLQCIRAGQRDDHPRLPFGDGVCESDGSLQPVGEDVAAD